MLEVASDVTVDNNVKRVASSKLELDNRISINTIIACITILGGVITISDRLSASAATTAVIQSKQIATDLSISALTTQRYTDRQEILLELKDIKSEIRESNKVNRR